MMKFYYGIWNNIYELPWPARFFFEIAIAVIMGTIIFLFLRKIKLIRAIKKVSIKVIIGMASKCLYIIGYKKTWAIQMEDKIIDWGNYHLENDIKGKTKRIMFIFFIVIYILATIPDLMANTILNSYYAEKLSLVKTFFLEVETNLSKGYEKFPPLFLHPPKVETSSVQESSTEEEIERLILNEKGEKGCNIRKDPNLNSDILGGANKSVDIEFLNEIENDGDRYWLKVYLPQEKIEGWISGKLVEEKQMERIRVQ